jgi:hypothetical protein
MKTAGYDGAVIDHFLLSSKRFKSLAMYLQPNEKTKIKYFYSKNGYFKEKASFPC